MKTDNVVIITADEGKIFKRISDDEIMGYKITLGVGDSADNYEEVDDIGTE